MGHDSKDDTITRLQGILRIAHGLREVAVAFHPPSRCTFASSDSTATIDSFDLPISPSLLPSLLEAGAAHDIAVAASRVYQLRAEELRQLIRESISTVQYQITELPRAAPPVPDQLIDKVVSTATKVYLRRLEQWKEDILDRVKQTSATRINVAPKSFTAFNHEYVPLLEHFFEENPFPTHADKIFLAKKSNMQYRQIHVWFQNRRNRTKKEGKTPARKATYKGATKSLDKLYEHMKCSIVDSEFQASPCSQQDRPAKTGIAQNNMLENSFTSSAPPHAFPSPYPPTCRYDPFPCRNGPAYLDKPIWRRVPSGKRSFSFLTSIDDLAEKLSHLSVYDGTRCEGSSEPRSHAAIAAITVVPSRAPHPSLIVGKYIQPTSIIQLPPSVRAPTTLSRAFRTPSPTSKPITLVPPLAPLHKSSLLRKRKITPLSQHFPGRIQNIHRETTPSGTSLTSPRLFSTDSESRGCSLSSASSPSTPSATGSIQKLSRLFGSPCRSPLDSPIHPRGLGDILAVSPPTVS